MKRSFIYLTLVAAAFSVCANVASASSSSYITVDEEQVVLSAGTRSEVVFFREEGEQHRAERTGEEVADRDSNPGGQPAVAFLSQTGEKAS